MAMMLMLKYGNAIDQNHATDTKNLDLYFVNPCTGEISRIDEYDDSLPCITKIPTSSPSTQAPTSSAQPTQLPSNAPSESNKNTIPQCFRCDYDSNSDENIVKVLFKYTVEMSLTDGIEKPDTYLPELEGKMLEILSPIVLSQCSAKVDVRKLDNNPTSQYPTKQRVLIAEKRLLSICSTPTDEHLPEG